MPGKHCGLGILQLLSICVPVLNLGPPHIMAHIRAGSAHPKEAGVAGYLLSQLPLQPAQPMRDAFTEDLTLASVQGQGQGEILGTVGGVEAATLSMFQGQHSRAVNRNIHWLGLARWAAPAAAGGAGCCQQPGPGRFLYVCHLSVPVFRSLFLAFLAIV